MSVSPAASPRPSTPCAGPSTPAWRARAKGRRSKPRRAGCCAWLAANPALLADLHVLDLVVAQPVGVVHGGVLEQFAVEVPHDLVDRHVDAAVGLGREALRRDGAVDRRPLPRPVVADRVVTVDVAALPAVG